MQIPPKLPPKTKKKLQMNKNFAVDQRVDYMEKMSMSGTSGTSIRTAATRDRHSPILRSPRMPKVRNIPVLSSATLAAPSVTDDRSITGRVTR